MTDVTMMNKDRYNQYTVERIQYHLKDGVTCMLNLDSISFCYIQRFLFFIDTMKHDLRETFLPGGIETNQSKMYYIHLVMSIMFRLVDNIDKLDRYDMSLLNNYIDLLFLTG